MAVPVAGAGKPAPQDPTPSKSGATAKPPSAPAVKLPAAKSATTPTAAPAANPMSTGTNSQDKVPTKNGTQAKLAAMSQLNEIKRIGRYTIVRKIGQGGMGTVFLANDQQLKRQVALKVLPKDKAENPTLVKRFKQEAQAAALLKDDNIIAVYDAGQADGYLYIAMEFIEGTDAHSLVSKRGPLPVKRALEVIKQTAAALRHAYEKNIVHRDIKPSNLMIRKDGAVKLADMGLARSIDESLETNITRAGTTVGTVDYMSPEQARNSKLADTRSDLYSLGATWFHLLTGSPPFPEGSMVNKLGAHAAKPRPDVRDINSSVPENIAEIIKRLMAIKPEDRYQTPAELLADLNNQNLTRELVTLKDLAALAQDDDEDDDARPEPKASYKKPEARESKQLMAPTMEIPVQSAAPAKLPNAKSDAAGSSKKPLVVGIVIVALICLGYIASQFGGSVATPNLPPPIAPGGDSVANSNNSASTTSTDGSNSPAADVKRSPRSLTNGSSNKSPGSTQSNQAAAGALYLPPISPRARDGEDQFLPHWITAQGTIPASSMKVIAVGGGPSCGEHVATIADALRQLPEAGGIVRLASDGPHFLGPIELRDRATVVIQAASGTMPLVVLVGDPDQPWDTLLQVTNGALTLENLHVMAFARQFPTSDPLTLIATRSGDMAAIGCTFTMLGTRPGKTFAFGAEGQVVRDDPKLPPRSRLFVRDCLVRGSALGAFRIDQAATELVASRSVFATGAASVVQLTNHAPPDEPPANASSAKGTPGKANDKTAKAKPVSTARSLKFLSCTVLSSGTAFELNPGINPSRPPTTEVVVANSLLAGISSPQATAVLMALPSWPQPPFAQPDDSVFQNLRCVIESTLVCGWQKLLLEEPGATSTVRTGAAWKELWHNQANLDESQFQSITWPPNAIADFAAISSRDVSVSADIGLKGSDGQPLGSGGFDFAEPLPLTRARADALADRAQYPFAGLETFPVNRTIRVDAGTQDLGKVLLAENWDSGTLVIVSGSGTHEMTPVEVKGKALRIEFQSSGDMPLVLTPPRAKDHEALFVVEHGSLELVGGQFRFPNVVSETTPSHFLSAYDGDFVLRRCQVIGQMADGKGKFQGLIRWKRTIPEPRDLSQHSERNSCLIVDSSLITTGTLMDADLRRHTLLVRNSLLVSLGDLFNFNIQGFDHRIDGSFDARWTTFAAGGNFLFQVRGTKDSEKATRPLAVFIENSAFLTLTDLVGTANTPALLSCRDDVLKNRQLNWWDHGNGYASPWTQFIRLNDSPQRSAQSIDADWKPLWGAAHVARPLTSAGGVRLKIRPSNRTKLTPRDFTLADDGPATTWGTNQTRLGVDFDRWDQPASDIETTAPIKPGAPGTPVPKTTPKKSDSPAGGVKPTKPTKSIF